MFVGEEVGLEALMQSKKGKNCLDADVSRIILQLVVSGFITNPALVDLSDKRPI